MIQIELIGKDYYPIYLNAPKGPTLDKAWTIVVPEVAGIICISSQIDNSMIRLDIPVVLWTLLHGWINYRPIQALQCFHGLSTRKRFSSEGAVRQGL